MIKVDLQNHGFKTPVIQPEEYTFAGREVTAVPINPSMDWTEYLPKKEIQHNKYFDNNSCFVYGSLNQIETLLKFITKEDYNYSERFNAYFSDWTPQGGNPHNVYQSLRHDGAVEEAVLPFNESITQDAYIVGKMPKTLIRRGYEWLEDWNLKHDWLFTSKEKNKHNLIQRGLGFCPIAVSVLAWKSKDGIYVKEKGEQDNHWCLLYKINKDDTYQVFDTYDSTHKTLAKDYDFQFAKRITLRKKIQKDNWFIELLKHIFIKKQYD